jgi:hypothetical protein
VRAVNRFLPGFALLVLGFAVGRCPAANDAAAPDVLAHLRAGHPRLLFTDDQLAEAIAAAKTDPLRAALHARIVELATAQLDTVPIKRELIGPRLLDKSRTCISRVLTCAMAYRLTHDERFAARAKRELLTAAAFVDWHPAHFLDVAEMSFAFAIGYDWLYAQLTPEERRTIKQALLEKGLVFASSAYAPGGPTNKQLWFVNAQHNWNQVCNGGLLAAALALADEEPALAELVIRGARQSLPLAMAAYAPDGAFPEGPGYWGYGTGYNVLAIAMLESALGTDLGLSAMPAFDRTVQYRLYVQSPSGLGFNYADGGAGLGAAPEYTWLARRFSSIPALSHSRTLLQEELKPRRRVRDADRFFALHAVWFPTEPPAAAPAIAMPPRDVRFRGPAELAMFRSAWNDPRALFVGLKAGRNDVNHAHLDLGSFVLDADGVRWAEDLGPDDYNLPGYFGAKRWTYFRLNNRGHNTLTPGETLQDPKALAPIIGFANTPQRAFAIVDLTAAYPGAAKRILRGVALLDRSRVLVQDDVTAPTSGMAFHWQLLTSAQVQIDDAHHATLSLGEKRLHVEIIAPAAARFSAAPARPPTAAEKQNAGISALVATVPASSESFQLAIQLRPAGDHWPAGAPVTSVVPVAEWK